MTEQRITARKNPLLQQVRKLLTSRKEREATGLFVADGTKLLQEAVRWYPGLDTVILADGVDAAAFAQAVRDALQGNQWICGFPETLVIASVEDCVVIAFGVNDAMTPFQTHLAEAYAGAQILFNEAIAG